MRTMRGCRSRLYRPEGEPTLGLRCLLESNLIVFLGLERAYVLPGRVEH